MKLAVIFTMVMFLFALTGTIILSYYNYQMANKILINEVENHLKTIVQSRTDHLETFLDSFKALTIQLSQSIVIERFLITNKTDKNYELQLNDAMLRLNNSAQVNPEIYDIFVLNKYGVVVVSNINERIGLDRSDITYFIYGKEQVYISDVYFSRFFDGQPSIAASSPIYSDTGEFFGVVVIRMDLDVLNTITKDVTGLGETGEIYLVNKDKLLITPSRFMNFSILVQIVDTENLRNCLSMQKTGEHKGHEQVISFTDYRGEEVIGAHEYLQEMQWCLLAKIDKSEVFIQPRKLFIQNTFIVLIILIAFFSVIGYFIGESLDKKYMFKKKGIKK